jgi:nucleotide-binding universal stress UspA family protein
VVTTRGLLVVVDESQASKRAVAYVAKIVGRQRGLRICLVHILPKDNQQPWLAGAKKAAQRAFGMAAATLREAGVLASALDVQFSEGVEGLGAAERVLDLARTRRCGTVVVGRESVSWFRKLMTGNLAAELVRRGKGYTIWVVE